MLIEVTIKKRLALYLNLALKPLDAQVVKLPSATRAAVSRVDPYSDNSASAADPDTRRVLNLLGYTKSSGSDYRAEKYPAGYHSIEMGGKVYRGQRNPAQRLAPVPFDFKGKSVLDIGCNQGGMLFAVADRISYGVGVDFDSRMINAANRVRSYKQQHNLDFYVFDLEKENFGYLQDFLHGRKVDIVFLLSVCMWIENWRDLIDWVSGITDHVLFETNGSPEQQREQEQYLSRKFHDVLEVAAQSDDDPGQKLRRLLLAAK